MSEPVKKKRGRKSKKELQELQEKAESQSENIEIDVNENPEPPAPKKRGRKPKVVNPDEPATVVVKRRGRKAKEKAYGKDSIISELEENENIIVHLPLKDDIENGGEDNVFNDQSFLNYDPNISLPVESETTGLATSDHSWIDSHETFGDNDNSDLLDRGPPPDTKFASYPFNQTKKRDIGVEKKRIDTTMKNFKDYNTHKEWPVNTDIHCFWDCSEIDGRPFGLPIKYQDGVFYMIGCFSSPEGAAAYNFNDSSINNKWYNYSLLNMMCRQMFNNPDITIKVAPPRQCLNKFGGNLTLKEFREMNTDYNKDYKILYPPVISIIPLQEEINIRKHSQSRYQTSQIPIDNEKILKLSRKKPLKNFEYTLDNCMKLQYN